MRQKKVVFGITKYKRRRYTRRKYTNLWQIYYNILKYWVEDFKKNKYSARSVQLTSRFKYSYLVHDAYLIQNSYAPAPSKELLIWSGSSINKSHYRTLNKHYFIKPSYTNSFLGGGIFIEASSPLFFNQYDRNELKNTHVLYFIADSHLIAYSSAPKKLPFETLILIKEDLYTLVLLLVLKYITAYYQTITYLTLKLII